MRMLSPQHDPCTLVKLAARFGFASRDDGEGDIFIPGRALHGAMPNDKINVKLFDHPRVEGSSEGEVVEVTVPNNRFAGTVCLSEDGRMAVEPDGCRDVKFLLAKQGSEGVHLGDKVGFLITHRGNRHSDHRAAVVEKFGSSDYASECAKAILYGRSVRQEFPPEVLEEAHAYDNATIDPPRPRSAWTCEAFPSSRLTPPRRRTSTMPSACRSWTTATSWAFTLPTSAIMSAPVLR